MQSAALTGFWSGDYRYDPPRLPVVPFIANIDERAGALTGTTSEPDVPRGGASGRLGAAIRGRRANADVTFAKMYDGAARLAHRVDYAGTVSDDGAAISGTWRLPGATGRFRMTRQLLDEVESEVRAEAEAERQPSPVLDAG